MAYKKRDFYKVPDNDIEKDLLLTVLYENGVKGSKARQLVFLSSPMSILRWSKYLKPSQIDKYLVKIESDEEKIDNDFGI